MTDPNITCTECGSEFDADELGYVCPDCGEDNSDQEDDYDE